MLRRTFSRTSVRALCGTLLLAQRVGATELEWSAPEGCSPAGFVQQVEDNLQRQLAALTLETILVTVTERTPSEWLLEFSLSEKDTQTPPSRRLTGASCADVSRAAAVAVAMALHARAALQPGPEPPSAARPGSEPPATPGGERRTSPRPGREPSPPVAARPEAASERHYRFPVQLLLLGDVSLLGTASYGLGAGLGVTRGRWEGGLSGAVLPKLELRTSDTLGMRLGATLGMASGCVRIGGPPSTPRACLGYEFGVVSGEGSGTGFRVTRERRALWHALRPEIGLGVPLASGLELRLFAGLAMALKRATFVFDAGRVGHEFPRVSARGTLGLSWAL